MSSSKLLITAVSGIALGTLIGILIAPASGRETRQKIRKGANNIKDTFAYRCLQAEDMLGKLRKQAGSDPAVESAPRTRGQAA